MTDDADVTACASKSENSNDADASEESKATVAETEVPVLSQQEIIARNRERAIQLRAAKRALPQEPSTLVSTAWLLTTLMWQNAERVNGIGRYSRVYRPTGHIIGNFGDEFTGQMTQPTMSQHWRTMVSQPRRGPIPAGSAH